jgi:hypothetical protein
MFTFGVGRMTVRLFPIVKTGWGEESGRGEWARGVGEESGRGEWARRVGEESGRGEWARRVGEEQYFDHTFSKNFFVHRF